jgi:two-component system sensor histidine kinase CpxA
MAARIEVLLKVQHRLIADVSHELKSPLTRLSLAIGLMRRQREPESRTFLARLERETERLNALVESLLTLSRLECLNQPPPMELIRLSALVREIAVDADFEATTMDRSVRLAECADCSMRGAPGLLRSAIENVVRNALKYTSPNTAVSIQLVCLNGERAVSIVVNDQGPGVPPEAVDHIFEPFYRVDDARDRRSGGAGLGLAITRQIVTLHGGTVSALNRDGGGLRVQITLPVSSAV